MRAGTKHKQHPKAVGNTSEAMVAARLVQAGKMVLMPFGENQRYDLVIDEGDRFVRVQCKTGRMRRGAIYFNTCSSTYHHPNNGGARAYQHSYEGQADVFGVYCPANDKVYLVPVDQVGPKAASLRLEPTLNNQSCGVRWAHEYELLPPG